MAGKGEEVASAIDAQVREAIEKLVGEIRSSVEDIRDAVNQQLTAALQSVQADVNSMTLLPQIQKALADMGPASGAAAPPPAPKGADAAALKRAVQAIERGKSQVDVLNALLEQAMAFGSRTALLILRGEMFSGWKGMGFTAHGSNDENIKRLNAAPGLVPEIDSLLKNERVVEWDGASLTSRVGATPPTRALLIPMVIKDKVAAALYVDTVDGRTIDRGSLELLVFTTGLLVDTLAIRKKIPSPTLSDEANMPAAAPQASASQAAAPAAPPRRPSLAQPAPTPAPAPAPPRPAAAAPRPAPAPQPAAPRADATVAFSAAQMREAVAAATPAAAPAAKSTGGIEGGSDDRPSTQFVPPAGMARGGAGQSPATEQSKKHDEARRFARLLVSEIKLYNEAKVEQGRKSGDLYERLKEDIDRSRQMYDERIPEDVRKTSNYFYDELVRVLADGNKNALGL